MAFFRLHRIGPTARLAAGFLIYLALRSLILGLAGPVWFSDSAAYADQYRHGFGGGLGGQIRSWGYPFFLWAAGYHWTLAALAQRLIAAAAWFALARAAASLFRSAFLRWFVFVALLLVSLTTFVVMWDPMLLSESLSLSLFAALTAMWIKWQLRNAECGLNPGSADALVRSGKPLATAWRFLRNNILPIAIALIAIPFAALRDSNIPLLIFLACLALGSVVAQASSLQLRRAGKMPALLISGLLLAVFLLLCAWTHQRDVRVSRRSWANIANVLSRTICARRAGGGNYVSDDENIAWLAAQYQMPRQDALARAGRFLSQPPPLTPRYEAWLKDSGPRAWAGFLRHHPLWVWRTYAGERQYSFVPMDYLLVEQNKWQRSMIGLSISLQWIFYRLAGWLFEMKALNTLLALGAAALGLGWILSSVMRNPQSTLRTPHSALRNPQSTLRTPHSALRNPQLLSARLGTLTWLIGTGALAALVAILGDTIETWRHAIVGLIAIYAALPIAAAAMANPLVEWARRMRNAEREMRNDIHAKSKKPARSAKNIRHKR